MFSICARPWLPLKSLETETVALLTALCHNMRKTLGCRCTDDFVLMLCSCIWSTNTRFVFWLLCSINLRGQKERLNSKVTGPHASLKLSQSFQWHQNRLSKQISLKDLVATASWISTLQTTISLTTCALHYDSTKAGLGCCHTYMELTHK